MQFISLKIYANKAESFWNFPAFWDEMKLTLSNSSKDLKMTKSGIIHEQWFEFAITNLCAKFCKPVGDERSLLIASTECYLVNSIERHMAAVKQLTLFKYFIHSSSNIALFLCMNTYFKSNNRGMSTFEQ